MRLTTSTALVARRAKTAASCALRLARTGTYGWAVLAPDSDVCRRAFRESRRSRAARDIHASGRERQSGLCR